VDAIKQRFAKIFEGLGTLGEEYQIKLKEDATPYLLYTPRNVPLPLREKVKEELERMEAMGVISKVDQPTPWCAGMVVVPKKSGAVRICVDLKPLNQSVLREVHPIPKVDDVLGKLAGATIFSKLDANSGFWQIPLAPESRLLTTFVTPFGRYCFNKLPFGISSAPELFQKRMSILLEGLDGVVCLMDDVLIFGSDQQEHDTRLIKVLERVQSAGVTLNAEKCELSKPSLKFLGHVIDKDGVRADPEKTAAICRMTAPQSVSDLRRFMGMVNQMGKFSPNIAEISKPLRELLSVKRAWLWGPEQDRAFKALKEELTKPTVLALYDVAARSKVSADASSFGLGAVLLQCKGESGWKPVAYASRSLTETERRYAQIEKEALAVTWSCEKFSDYILGSKFEIETDHKPLVPLLSNKRLNDLPPRVLRFRLRMAKYDYTISHVPGKLLYTADTLSRDPAPNQEPDSLQEEVETFVNSITKLSLPATEQRLEIYRQSQEQDPVCTQVREFCRTGWPNKQHVPQELMPYWKVKSSLTICDNLLLYNLRIVVPKSMQSETLQKIHAGHLGIEKCKKRTSSSVWWPGVMQPIVQVVQNCQVCAKETKPGKEPLISTLLPKYPWQVVGTDLFELNKNNYLLVVDYFSRYPEVVKVTSTTSASIIAVLKSIFARHGIPEIVRSDNGPQYSSAEFMSFASSYGFQHITSSPKFPQSNGQAERCVQTVKNLLKKSDDPNVALLSYRSTPLSWCDLSPAELCMGRRLRTSLPLTDKMLTPQWPFLEKFREQDKAMKEKQKENFDSRHRARDLPTLPNDTEVWIMSEDEPVHGRVVSPADRPRSYIVETPTGQIERNRSQLQVVPNIEDTESETIDQRTETETVPETPRRIMTRSRTGTAVTKPDRLV
jgi:transposase InsO family protein